VQIQCEKCSTTYAVEDGLIPPGGAPVQCTKCGNLFTAYPSPPEPKGPSKTVMMFSPGQAAAAPPPARVPTPAPIPAAAPAPRPAQAAPEAPAPVRPALAPTLASPPPPAKAASSDLAPTVASPILDPNAARETPAPVRPGKLTQQFFTKGDSVDRAHEAASKGEASRKPGQTQIFSAAADLEEQLARKSRLGLMMGLGVVALLLGAIFFSLILPDLLGPKGSDAASVKAHARAMENIRRDDGQSLALAQKSLGSVVTRKPDYADAMADRSLALGFLAGQKSLQTDRLRASYEALERQVNALGRRKEQADWAQQANDKIAEMKKIRAEYDPLAKEAQALGVESLALAQAALKADPASAAALRALGFNAAELGDAEKEGKLLKSYVKVVGKPDGWAELMEGELAAAGKPSEAKRTAGKAHLATVLKRDPGLIRAYFLLSKLDAAARDELALKVDVSVLAGANPTHDGAAQLLAALQESLAREKAEKDAQAQAQAAAAAPAPSTKAAAGHSSNLPRRSH